MEDLLKDDRFASIAKDPRFRKQKRIHRKVTIDKRFQGMFDDKKFQVKYSVDKRGRPVQQTTNENLKKYYDLESSDSDTSNDSNDCSDNEHEDSDIDGSEIDEVPQVGTSSDSIIEIDRNDRSLKGRAPQDVKTMDFARGVGNVETSSSEDEEDTDEKESEEEIDHGWMEQTKSVPTTEEATRRLAVCNMDWDRLKAQDLLVMLSSFTPTGAVISSVSIYPSDFGLERMKEEDLQGPKEIVENSKAEGEDEEYGSTFEREVLRKYQMNRMKYYYAVVECDSAETADHIYTQTNGTEYEASGNVLDLRFIPDDMTFDDRKPKSQVKSTDVLSYKPATFGTSALQQSKVDLTWDETDHNRLAITKRKFNKDELEDMDFKDYLASDSSGDENPYPGLIMPTFDTEDSTATHTHRSREDYRNVLLASDVDSDDEQEEDRDEQQEMTITWDSGLAEKTKKLAQKKEEKQTDKTPWEKYMDKKKEKKQKKKEAKKKSEQKDSDEEKTAENDLAFSDDDLPEGVNPEDFISSDEPNSKAKKTKKKKKKSEKTSEATDESKAELELLLMDEDDTKQHYNLTDLINDNKRLSKRQRKKRNMEKQKAAVKDNFKMNYSDSRFERLYTDSAFNIDPSATEFKKTAAMEGLIKEKLKRRKKQQHIASSSAEDKTSQANSSDLALSSLVQSVKAKAKTMKNTEKKSFKRRKVTT